MNIQSLVALTTNQPQSQLSLSENEPTISLNTDSTNTNTTVSSSEQTGEEFSTFLTLLTAQIRNQDPLAPLDSTQFVEQLATFSNLELQVDGNEVLEDIAFLLAQALTANDPQPETDLIA